MEKYKRLMGMGPTYFFTTSPNEIPKKTREAIEKQVSLDFERERLLAACGMDRFGGRGNFWVVVTEERVLAFKAPSLHQNFFSDLTGVEKSFTGNVVLLSPGNKSDLFHIMAMSKKDLADRIFQIVHGRWLAVRSTRTKSTTSTLSENADSVSQLERLSKLHEQGHLTDAEFSILKAKILGTEASCPPVKQDT